MDTHATTTGLVRDRKRHYEGRGGKVVIMFDLEPSNTTRSTLWPSTADSTCICAASTSSFVMPLPYLERDRKRHYKEEVAKW